MKVACLHFVLFMLFLCVKSFCKKRSEIIPNNLIYITTNNEAKVMVFKKYIYCSCRFLLNKFNYSHSRIRLPITATFLLKLTVHTSYHVTVHQSLNWCVLVICLLCASTIKPAPHDCRRFTYSSVFCIDTALIPRKF